MKKNEIYRTEITAISTEGMGICKIDGMAVFVANTAIGDVFDCKIVKVLKKYAFGICEKLITASTEREETSCPVFQKCGGCVFRHINYNAEAQIKETRVKDAIERIGGYKGFEPEKICMALHRDRYRNKAQIPLGKDKDGNLIMGFYGKHSHRIVDTDDCLLQAEDFKLVMEIFRIWQKKYTVSIYDENSGKGLLRHLYLRKAETTDQLMVCLVSTAEKIPYINQFLQMLLETFPDLTSLIININKEKTNVILGKKCVTFYGQDYITDTLCGKKFNISPLSFYQVNRTQAEKLYEKAKEYADLKKGEIILDLYCGAGTIGLSMADDAEKLIGVEIIPQAIENAKINAKLNNFEKAEFICGDASEAAKILESRGEKPSVIILDPPRKGCDKELIETVCKMNPERIVYISCDPATLARDLKIFSEKTFTLKKAQAFDLFPASAHCEVVSLIVNKTNCT